MDSRQSFVVLLSKARSHLASAVSEFSKLCQKIYQTLQLYLRAFSVRIQTLPANTKVLQSHFSKLNQVLQHECTNLLNQMREVSAEFLRKSNSSWRTEFRQFDEMDCELGLKRNLNVFEGRIAYICSDGCDQLFVFQSISNEVWVMGAAGKSVAARIPSAEKVSALAYDFFRKRLLISTNKSITALRADGQLYIILCKKTNPHYQLPTSLVAKLNELLFLDGGRAFSYSFQTRLIQKLSLGPLQEQSLISITDYEEELYILVASSLWVWGRGQPFRVETNLEQPRCVVASQSGVAVVGLNQLVVVSQGQRRQFSYQSGVRGLCRWRRGFAGCLQFGNEFFLIKEADVK